MKIEGSESAPGSESGSIIQKHGFEDPDPDPHQNVMEHGMKFENFKLRTGSKRVRVFCRDYYINKTEDDPVIAALLQVSQTISNVVIKC